MIRLKSKFLLIQIDEILVINWGLKQLYLNLYLIAENKDASIYVKKEEGCFYIFYGDRRTEEWLLLLEYEIYS